MNIDFDEDTYEGLPFAPSLSMAMMERLGLREMIDIESRKVDDGCYNLSVGMTAKAFVGSMTSEMGRRPIYRTNAVFDTAPKDKIFGPFVKDNGLNDRILRDRLTAISKMDLPELQWRMYQHIIEECDLHSFINHLDATDIDLWGSKYGLWEDGGAQPKHNNHPKSKRKHLMQKEIHTICDGNGIPVHSRVYDGNVSDIEMNRDSIEFLSSHTDIENRVLIADCKLAVGDIIERLLDVRTHFITKVPTNFSEKIRDDIVRSAMLGIMDESPEHKGRLYYDTDSDTVLGKGVNRNLRFVAFSLPGGYERSETYIRGQGLKSFTRKMSSLGKFHCEKDAREAFDKALRSSYGAYTAEPNIYLDKRLVDKDPNGPCWRAKAKDIEVVESNVKDAAKAYSVNVLVTNLPRDRKEDIREGATADMVIDAYLGQHHVEHTFRLIKSYLNVGRVYIHSPARQDAMIFLTSVTAMIHAVVDNILSPDLDSLPTNPYEDPETEEKHLTMKHIVDFMVNTTVLYDRERDTMRISGAPGESEKAWSIVRELDIEPKLLLGY